MNSHITPLIRVHCSSCTIFNVSFTFLVGCQGAVQLGVLAPRFVRGGPAKIGGCKPSLRTTKVAIFAL